MNFCPKCYGQLAASSNPKVLGHCAKCKQTVLMKSNDEPLKAKMNAFVAVNLSKQIDQLQATANELLAEVKSLRGLK